MPWFDFAREETEAQRVQAAQARPKRGTASAGPCPLTLWALQAGRGYILYFMSPDSLLREKAFSSVFCSYFFILGFSLLSGPERSFF